MRDAAGRFFVRAVGPGDVADGGGRAGFDALRVAVAEEALAGDFVFFVVEAHHVPGAGLLAEAAADAAFLDNDTTGARLRVNAE